MPDASQWRLFKQSMQMVALVMHPKWSYRLRIAEEVLSSSWN